MVKVKAKEEDAYTILDNLIRAACATHGLKLFVDGWTRKTYDVYREKQAEQRSIHLARIESIVTTTGEIRYFNDQALPFLEALGAELETAFKLEVTLVFDKSPNA